MLQWIPSHKFNRFEGLQNGWGAIGWDENQEKVYITSNLGRDTYAISLLDPNTGEMEDVFEADGAGGR